MLAFRLTATRGVAVKLILSVVVGFPVNGRQVVNPSSDNCKLPVQVVPEVDTVTVAGFTALLNLTVMVVETETAVAPSAGMVEIIDILPVVVEVGVVAVVAFVVL